MDWDGLKRRTRQVTRMPFPVSNFILTPDSRTIVFVTSEPAGIASVPVIYSIFVLDLKLVQWDSPEIGPETDHAATELVPEPAEGK